MQGPAALRAGRNLPLKEGGRGTPTEDSQIWRIAPHQNLFVYLAIFLPGFYMRTPGSLASGRFMLAETVKRLFI